ncbi:hypothetical protein N9U06_00375 [Gammaproteobacteria bacterium]|nr:hypothetical protein [Gammaproteobacteria bacterium]
MMARLSTQLRLIKVGYNFDFISCSIGLTAGSSWLSRIPSAASKSDEYGIKAAL